MDIEPENMNLSVRLDFQTLISSISDALYGIDRDWRLVYVNDLLCEMVGRSPEQIIGLSFWELFPDLINTDLHRQFHQALDEQMPSRVECFYEPWNQWYDHQIYPTPDGIAVVGTDITDRKRSELMLIEQNRLLKLMATGRSKEDCLRAVCDSVSQMGALAQTCVSIGDKRWASKWRNAIAGPDLGQAVEQDRVSGHTVPIADSEGLPLGSLMLCFEEVRDLTDWEVQIAEFGAQYASIVLERDRTTSALRRSEAKYRTLFDSMDEGFCICEMLFDAEGNPVDYKFLEANPMLEVLTGMKQVVGRTMREMVPDLETDWYEIYASVVRTGESVRFEQEAKAMNRWFDVNAFCIGEPQKNQFAALFTNTTARKQSEHALQTSEARNRNILESVTDAVFAVDENWRFTYLNPQAENLLSSSDELLGKDMWTEYPGLVGSDFERTYRLAIQQQTASSTLAFYPDHDRWYEVHAYPAASGMTAYFRNVTHQKQLEAAFKSSFQQLRAIYNSTSRFMGLIDPNGTLIEANHAIFSFAGVQPEAAIGSPFWDIAWFQHTPGASETIQQSVQRAFAGEHLRFDLPLTNLNSEQRTFEILFYPIRDEADDVVLVVPEAADITKRRAIEQERESLLERERKARVAAELANRTKDEFLAVVSHELRTPLNPILGWAQLLQTRQMSPEKTAHALGIIGRNAKMQAQLINDLLDISRILGGKLSLNAVPVDMVAVVQSALETVQLSARAKSISIQTELNPNTTEVLGDANRLQQAVWNLLSNAIKFTPLGGRVDIRLACVENAVQLTVSDTGKGIHVDFLPYLFEHFRQEDATITRQFGGLGLGLSIVRHLVELHGGTIQAHSAGADQGAIFIARLPLMPEQFTAQSLPIEPTKLPSDLRDIKILVVDDDDSSRDYIASVLEIYGASVVAVASANEAIAHLTQSQPDQEQPDILISDIGMPDIDGYSLIQQVRALPPEQGGQILAIALTAYASELDYQQAMMAGFQRHITKPAEPDAIVEVIALLLSQAS